MKILIVDDCTASVSSMKEVLANAGYTTTIAVSHFEQAMAVLSASAETDASVDLVIIGVDMPGIGGIGAVLTIKSHRAYEDIPVIVVTEHNDEAILDQAFAAGASDYIVKPVSAIELRARVRSALQLRREMVKRLLRERELERLARKLERMSNLDSLTGLANRRCFDDTLVKEWVRNGRADAHLGLIMLDIDHFKHYNDALGHVDGDTCLRRVAEAIKGVVHRPGDMVARYGGEEFAVILPGTDYTGAMAVADNIHASVAQTSIEHPDSAVSCVVTVSIGVSSGIPTCGSTPEQLIQAADRALYEAKEAGRNRTRSTCLPGPEDLRQ
ncbi:GGDEF domain-containing response regulator [Pseudodesulfovibrio aespoeensis]|uniref:GGDEF domain-containing response regulator n=1 Tax=Pseudodesulfovibrio aespoeensis TaxID=182210 RepID=UPI0023556691|nr:diguanylate cyclase [Pseudodesulfovibrio aespoeensis]MCG2733680.1 diguanylate cyclase [Pseudodesulfovibrio aespoeensis]